MPTELAIAFVVGFGFIVLIALALAGWGTSSEPTAD